MTTTVSRMTAGSPEAWQAVAEVMPEVRRAIHAHLRGSHRGMDADDVAQITASMAVEKIEQWDPRKGRLVAWVTVIGKRRVFDLLRKPADVLTPYSLEVGDDRDDDLGGAAVVPSHEDACILRTEVGDAGGVLREVAKVVNEVKFQRAMSLVLDHDGDTTAAAQALGVIPASMREARREITRTALIIRNAQNLHESGAPLTHEALLDCLPDGTGSWVREITEEYAKCGGFSASDDVTIARALGWSISTTRQRRGDAQHLLQVAYTVAKHGCIPD